MRGVRWEPAEVWLNDGRPARFGWRGRIYTVLAILERPPGDARSGEAGSAPSSASPSPSRSQGSGGGRPGGAGWQCWRVSASPGKNVPVQAFRLCHEVAVGRWLLSRDGG